MTLMQENADFLGELLNESAGREVVIRRQQRVATPTITGWVSGKEYTEVGENGVATTVVMDDWIFKAADIVIGGEQVELRDGDLIVETLNGVEHTYEVLPLQNRKSCEWRDTSGILLLVHSKRVGRA